MTGAGSQADVTLWQAGLEWAIDGLGDFNGDGRDDFLLQRQSDGVLGDLADEWRSRRKR